MLKTFKDQQEYDKSERCKTSVKGRQEFQTEVRGNICRSPEKTPDKVSKLTEVRKAAKLKTVKQDSRLCGKRLKEGGVKQNMKNEMMKKSSVSHRKSHILKSSRVVNVHRLPPSKDIHSSRCKTAASEKTSNEREASKEEITKCDSLKTVAPSLQIATLDHENKTVKLNLRNAVVELHKLKLTLI